MRGEKVSEFMYMLFTERLYKPFVRRVRFTRVFVVRLCGVQSASAVLGLRPRDDRVSRDSSV